jgi:hypothetical protein
MQARSTVQYNYLLGCYADYQVTTLDELLRLLLGIPSKLQAGSELSPTTVQLHQVQRLRQQFGDNFVYSDSTEHLMMISGCSTTFSGYLTTVSVLDDDFRVLGDGFRVLGNVFRVGDRQSNRLTSLLPACSLHIESNSVPNSICLHDFQA